ncbi:MAG: hypothetical protein IKN38_00205 [Clostridia bacterium]|nr:hypothetical protein [Clostridia bacterium]
MPQNNEHDFALERHLRKLDPELHRHFTDAVFGLQHILSNYKLLFPTFTDHTELHSLTVIDFCNRLIGDQIDRMNADEIYTLLLGCYFHDTGMGVSKKDYEAFSKEIDFGDYFETHSADDVSRVIRDFHNEYSGLFIRKYAEFFEIPSEEHLWAIIEISRGHRKTSLMDEKQYPISLQTPRGSTLCLPYLAALIRLADEIDVTKLRNPALIYDSDSYVGETERIEFKRHDAIKDLEITPDEFVLCVSTDDHVIMESIVNITKKMQKVLDECRVAVLERTPFVITQKRVAIKELDH